VLLSYDNPVKTFETNVMGAVNVLAGAFSSSKVETVVVVTTDKVYENKNSGRRFVESDSLAGKDPYSASKVGTEAAAAAWTQLSRAYGGPTIITARAGNVIGGGDLAKDRIIPDIIRGISQSSEVEIRNPDSTRPWQHALDPIVGYLLAAIDGTSRKDHFSVNFGPTDSSLPVREVVESAKSIFGDKINFKYPKESINSLESHLLDLDSTWARLNLDWFPARSQNEAIKETFLWWDAVLTKTKSASEACAEDINRFIKAHKL
jgi:CDP-glucose 4,6-dehydratase